MRLPPACVTMYSLTLVFSRDVAPLPRHVMPHTDGAVIVKSIWSRRRDIVPFISAPAKILSQVAVSQESPRTFSTSQNIYPVYHALHVGVIDIIEKISIAEISAFFQVIGKLSISKKNI